MRNFITFFLIIFFTSKVLADQTPKMDEHIKQEAQTLLKNIFEDNASHVRKTPDPELAKIQKGQTPRATVVSCSDSRVQSVTIDNTPINNLFYIRNIGNQIDTALGSVKYGVLYLHTPVLLIIGHVDCGAVNAALGDYRSKPKAVRKELYTFDFPQNITAKEGVIINVHNQVRTALELFSNEVQQNKLIIIGTVYDFKNEYKKGYNRLIVVNLNGEKNPEVISKSKYFEGIHDIKIGVN